MTFYLPPIEKSFLFLLIVVCPQYTFSLPILGNCYFLVFQNACPNMTFTCPGKSGKCLCSTLQEDFRNVQSLPYKSPLPLSLPFSNWAVLPNVTCTKFVLIMFINFFVAYSSSDQEFIHSYLVLWMFLVCWILSPLQFFSLQKFHSFLHCWLLTGWSKTYFFLVRMTFWSGDCIIRNNNNFIPLVTNCKNISEGTPVMLVHECVQVWVQRRIYEHNCLAVAEETYDRWNRRYHEIAYACRNPRKDYQEGDHEGDLCQTQLFFAKGWVGHRLDGFTKVSGMVFDLQASVADCTKDMVVLVRYW